MLNTESNRLGMHSGWAWMIKTNQKDGAKRKERVNNSMTTIHLHQQWVPKTPYWVSEKPQLVWNDVAVLGMDHGSSSMDIFLPVHAPCSVVVWAHTARSWARWGLREHE